MASLCQSILATQLQFAFISFASSPFILASFGVLDTFVTHVCSLSTSTTITQLPEHAHHRHHFSDDLVCGRHCFVSSNTGLYYDDDREGETDQILQDGHSTMFVFEMKDGYDYRNHMNNMVFFNKTVKKLHKEITKNKNATDDQIKMIAQIQANKSIAWMEGPLRWTAWVDQFEDLLH
ncbi:uncharacterized protein LOC131858924 [Cryptomeria japonica]|uniref:uncharacterized protein LOC131858924 n=1 Tax=Cryptomeria japonica TaxID=3369 RepID=UPI0027D9F2B3|nr:uncharacterized protein LOC131858924 [Cryptomeria japonica]